MGAPDTSWTARRRTLALAALVALGGCRSACSCARTIVRAATEKPPMEVVQREVPPRLREDASTLAQLCGLPVERVVPERVHSVVVSASPTDLPGLSERSLDVRVEVTQDDGRMLVCTGVVLVAFTLVAGAHAAADAWRFARITLTSVTTPGVAWTAPAGSGHHHHHHH